MVMEMLRMMMMLKMITNVEGEEAEDDAYGDAEDDRGRKR